MACIRNSLLNIRPLSQHNCVLTIDFPQKSSKNVIWKCETSCSLRLIPSIFSVIFIFIPISLSLSLSPSPLLSLYLFVSVNIQHLCFSLKVPLTMITNSNLAEKVRSRCSRTLIRVICLSVLVWWILSPVCIFINYIDFTIWCYVIDTPLWKSCLFASTQPMHQFLINSTLMYLHSQHSIPIACKRPLLREWAAEQYQSHWLGWVDTFHLITQLIPHQI